MPRTTRLPFALLACVLLTSALHAAPRVTRMPEITRTATGLLENEPADESGRPEWTSARRFSTTRVYIQKAPWEVGFDDDEHANSVVKFSLPSTTVQP